ncbi:MAG: hypothetical protein WBK26_17030 [Burkholderiaceae bacterium]
MELADLHARPVAPGGVRATSVAAYNAEGATKQRNSQAALVLQVMREAQTREGVTNFTCREIVERLGRARPDLYFHPGNVSARLVDLKKSGQVVVSDRRRCCTVSGSRRECEVVMLPLRQERLVP